MQLSDTITDQVVYSIHLMLNDWNGYDDEDCDDEDIILYYKRLKGVIGVGVYHK